MWLDQIPLRVKLYGNLEGLRRTAAIVIVTGISVYCTTKKKNATRGVPVLPPSSVNGFGQ